MIVSSKLKVSEHKYVVYIKCNKCDNTFETEYSYDTAHKHSKDYLIFDLCPKICNSCRISNESN